ncbi:permease prefix domain 1-containing protein [Demequina sp. NBRC 110053]|uniref:permease prefix domain 1-containing protein n=1 Tax=Demequina sp. NBRC 110053 TaxID=1570342 RepID=UPI000A075307|nr:permease prefix domain 1-containing protein [Demequina sp. NBRC 110053]
MNVIFAYLDTMFSTYPQTPRMLEAKTELRGMMEDAYTSLIAEGRTENEAVGQVIRDFGNLEEVAPVLGISADISSGTGANAVAGSAGPSGPAAPSYAAITLDEAQSFADAQRVSSRRIGLAVALFVLSPIALIVGSGAAQAGVGPWNEETASLIGLLILLTLVAVGVLIIISSGRMSGAPQRIVDDEFSASPEVTAWARDLSSRHETHLTRSLQVAIAVWILSVAPILVTTLVTEGTPHHQFWATVGVGGALAMVAAGLAVFLPRTWARTAAEKLEEGSSPEGVDGDDDETSVMGIIAAIYWPLLTTIFLAWGFIGDAWDRSWIVWPIGAVLFGAIAGGVNAIAAYRGSRR